MRSIIVLSLLLLTVPLSAANLWFDPPNPTSRTFVTARIQAVTNCLPNRADVVRTGQKISITVKQPEVCPLILTPADGFSLSADLGFLPAGVYDVTVGAEKLLILLAQATLAVDDGAPVMQIFPNVAPESGGDDLTIVGAGIAPVCAVAPCPAPAVLFGDAPATVIQQISTNQIVVRAPAHAPGTVDVTLSVFGQTFRAIAAFHYFAFDDGHDAAFFEPVLFPVMVQGPGAFGSQWSTEVLLRNDNDYTFPVSSIFDRHLPSFHDGRPPAHFTSEVVTNLPDGYLLYIPRQASPRVFFSTLVRDLSRQAEALGTEMPVVRETDFFDRTFTLLNVPTDARYRVALRLYRIDDRSMLRIRVRQMSSEETALVDEDIELSPAGSHRIAYIGDLVARYPQLAGKGPLRIDVDTSVASPASWGFVSVTNNATQHVTVISPQ